jgi:NAD(P)-dependent dehydrogenase (short-subunit alcohol dehydrogenase family)
MPNAQRQRPPQERIRPPGPRAAMEAYRGAGKLLGKVALITGGDRGIGRAVAIGFAKEGADVAGLYRDQHGDAEMSRSLVEAERLEDIDAAWLERSFRTNVLAMFHVTKAALAHLCEGAAIINTASLTTCRGGPHPIDAAATHGAIIAFTRSFAANLEGRGIRVNAVAPGAVRTPPIRGALPAEAVEGLGARSFLGRPAEPDEIAPSYIFLASGDSACMTGQVLRPNDEIVGA